MEDLGVIDQFTNAFAQYIDTGFGLLGGEVHYLTATLIAIDMALAGVFWALEGREVIPQLLKKILYVGAFAFILGNFAALSRILFQSFAGLGLTATASPLTPALLFRPGALAATGVTAGQPLLNQLGDLTGFPDLFLNLDTIVVLGIAWVGVILSFFILSVQMFVILIEFKLTSLAGFVLVPFALWNKTAFLAERVLGNVVASGIKVLVLAVIAGIGQGLFAQFGEPSGNTLTIQNALAILLGSLALLGLGIFGPGIATGLVSGAPQLGAGAAAGTAIAAGGVLVAGTAAVAGTARLAAAGLSAARIGGGDPPTPPAGGDGEPAWAERLRTARAGLRMAAQAMRQADRPGSGSGPSLSG